MSNSASERTPAASTLATELGHNVGFGKGDYVQEIGYDDDVDQALCEAIEAIIGDKIADAEEDDVYDVILMWWRSDDDDLIDGLVDAQATLKEEIGRASCRERVHFTELAVFIEDDADRDQARGSQTYS